MNKNLEDYINGLRIENIVWYAYISLIVFNIISNKYEEKHVITKNIEYRNIFRNINVFVLICALLIIAFFLIKVIKDNNNGKNDKKSGKLSNLSLISSILVLIVGIIDLYIELHGYNEELEI